MSAALFGTLLKALVQRSRDRIKPQASVGQLRQLFWDVAESVNLCLVGLLAPRQRTLF